MTIETKYQSGNNVWFLLDNKAIEREILQTRIHEEQGTWSREPKIQIEYKVGTNGFGVTKYIEESLLFPSKEELLNSL